MTYLFWGGLFYLTGVVIMAQIIMPYIRRSIRLRSDDWGISARQVEAMSGMSDGDFWWVAIVWPMLAVMWLLMKVAGLFSRG